MNRKDIKYRNEKGLFVINIDYGPRNETEFDCFIDKLTHIRTLIAADNSINVVLIIGEEDAFNTAETYSSRHLVELEKEGYKSLSDSLSSLECPVIVAIAGRANGQGLELVLAGDIRIAEEGSSFCLPQLHDGIIPFDGGTQRLSRIVGKAKALEMILTGEVIDGEEARRIGLVNRLVPCGELITSAMDVSCKMVQQAPLSLRCAKEAIERGIQMNIIQGLHLEADLYFLLHTTKDRREGIQAFIEKRQLQFEGK